MFNPRPRVWHQPLDPALDPAQDPAHARSDCAVVVDDFLLDPRALVELAARHREAFAPPTHNAFPGPELPLPDSLTTGLTEQFALRARDTLGARRVRQASSRLSLATLQPHELGPMQRLCHRDRLGTGPDELPAACVLYLFDEPSLGGTAFYRPRRSLTEAEALLQRAATGGHDAVDAALGTDRGYLLDSNAWFERTAVIAPRFNRAIFYAGDRFHSSHIVHPERLAADPARGRLTLNAFFVCRRKAR